MLASFNQRIALMNSLCRICGQEDKNCISIFSESCKKQEIEKKIRLCLPLILEEEIDTLPKQICLTCLHKLESTWELVQLCKNGQLLIEKKLYSISENESREQILFKQHSLIDDRVRALSVDRPITIGNSVIITLQPVREAPPVEVPPPPVSSEPVVDIMQGYQVSAPINTAVPATMPQPASDTNSVYPQGLIQVLPSNKPVLYPQTNNIQPPQRPQPVPAPRRSIPQSKRSMPPPKVEGSPSRPSPSRRRNLPNTSKRALKNGNVPAPKRVLLLCKYCRKSFPDEIIDHHVSLHLRQSFFTCIDCNKNFRSEIAMSRHRCGSGTTDTRTPEESINLDPEPDDDLICL